LRVGRKQVPGMQDTREQLKKKIGVTGGGGGTGGTKEHDKAEWGEMGKDLDGVPRHVKNRVEKRKKKFQKKKSHP